MQDTNNIESTNTTNTEDKQKSVYVKSSLIFTLIFAGICAVETGIFALIFLVLAPNLDKGFNAVLSIILALVGVIVFLLLISMVKATCQENIAETLKKFKRIFVCSQITLLVICVAGSVLCAVLPFLVIKTEFVAGDFSQTENCSVCIIEPADGGKAIFRKGMSKNDEETYYYCVEHFIRIQELVNEDNNGKKDTGNSVDESDAWYAAKETVKDNLKAPSTAKFCSMSSATITHVGKTWTIKGYVDAENSFGAKIRNNFTVVITFTSDTKYTIDSCIITPK